MAISKFFQGCPAQQRQRRDASFLGLTGVRRGWRHRHSQLQPPRPSHLLFSLPTTPSYSPSPSSTLFKLLLVLLVLCAVALLLFQFTPLSLSSFVIICQRLNTRPKQSVFQLNIFCRDLCFCDTTSTVKPFKPSKWAKHLQNTSRPVSSVQTSSDEGSYHHLWRATGTLFILQRAVWWLHLKHAISFTF